LYADGFSVVLAGRRHRRPTSPTRRRSRHCSTPSDTLDESIAALAAGLLPVRGAPRHVKVTNKNWTDPTPMEWHITYLLAAPSDHAPAKVVVIAEGVAWLKG
jgi:hypothetical protein